MPRSAPEWNPMDEPPPKPGRYMLRTKDDFWSVATWDGEKWDVTDEERLQLAGWREIQ